MITLSDIRTRVRKDLHDTDSGAYRWTDAQLDRHIERSLSDLSLACPHGEDGHAGDDRRQPRPLAGGPDRPARSRGGRTPGRGFPAFVRAVFALGDDAYAEHRE